MSAVEAHIESSEASVWYAMRVTYHREMRVKENLDACGVENFVPMQYKRVVRGEQMVKVLVPSVHNLIFVRMTPEAMKRWKASTELPVRYIMDRATGKPLLVPSQQMQHFMTVAGTHHEQLIYLNPNPGDFARGDRVRVMAGVFEGAEGVLVRVKGDRRVVVAIEGLVAVATTFIHPSMLEKINP